MSAEAWDSDEKVDQLIAAGAGKLCRIFASDKECLRRFLRARRGKVEKAMEMLLEHQNWRKSETPWWPKSSVDLSSIKSDLESCKAYTHGVDKDGCPLTFVRAGLHDKNEDRAQLKRFMTFLNDDSVYRIEGTTPTPPGMTIVVDFTGFGYSSGFDVNAGMLIIQTLSNHYPERLRKIAMTNTPFVVSTLLHLH